MTLLESRSDQLYAVARAVAGFLFLAHGVQKLFGGLGAEQPVDLLSLLGARGSSN